MVQAARSGRQNIAEGSRAAATSSQTELRLLNVARSSIEELLLDFEDYLRHRHLPQWAPDSLEALAVRRVPGFFKKDRTDRTDPSDRTDQKLLKDKEHWALYAPWLEHDDPSVRANALICLINQANHLLDQQIASLEKQFVEEGGYSEQLAAARMAARSRKKAFDRTDRSDQSNRTDQKNPTEDPADHIPACPLCGSLTVLRTAKSGKNAGKQFWGCSAYPECKGVVKV
jgi:four helix bundle suffix protein